LQFVIVVQEAQNWKPLSFEKVKNDLVWRGIEVSIHIFTFWFWSHTASKHEKDYTTLQHTDIIGSVLKSNVTFLIFATLVVW